MQELEQSLNTSEIVSRGLSPAATVDSILRA